MFCPGHKGVALWTYNKIKYVIFFQLKAAADDNYSCDDFGFLKIAKLVEEEGNTGYQFKAPFYTDVKWQDCLVNSLSNSHVLSLFGEWFIWYLWLDHVLSLFGEWFIWQPWLDHFCYCSVNGLSDIRDSTTFCHCLGNGWPDSRYSTTFCYCLVNGLYDSRNSTTFCHCLVNG